MNLRYIVYIYIVHAGSYMVISALISIVFTNKSWPLLPMATSHKVGVWNPGYGLR